MERTINKRKGFIIAVFAVIAIISSVIFACGTTNKASAAEPEAITEAYLKSLDYQKIRPYGKSSTATQMEYEIPLERWIKIYVGEPYFNFTLTTRPADKDGTIIGEEKTLNSYELSFGYQNVERFVEETTADIKTLYLKFPGNKFNSVIFHRFESEEAYNTTFKDAGYEPYIGYELKPFNYTYQGLRLWYEFDSAETELENDVWYKTKITSDIKFKYVSASGNKQEDMDCSSYLKGTETFTDEGYQYVKFPSSVYYRVWICRMSEENYGKYKENLGYTPYFGYVTELPTSSELKALKYKNLTLYNGDKPSVKYLPVDRWIKMKIESYIQFSGTSIYGKEMQFTCNEFPVDAQVKVMGDVDYYVKFPSSYFSNVGFTQMDNTTYQQVMSNIGYTPSIEYEASEEEPEPPIESDSSSDVSGSDSQSVGTESVNDSESNGKDLKGLIGVVSAVAGIIVISVAVYFVLAAFKPRRRRR